MGVDWGLKDISEKETIRREAEAEGKIILKTETLRAIEEKNIEKGNPLEVARVAGVMAAKGTSVLIPYCHQINITHVEVQFSLEEDGVLCRSRVVAYSRTGVEMEALSCVSASLLTIWDMVKYLEKDEDGQYPATAIREIRVLKKIKLPR